MKKPSFVGFAMRRLFFCLICSVVYGCADEPYEQNPAPDPSATPVYNQSKSDSHFVGKGWLQVPIPVYISSEFDSERKAALIFAMNVWQQAVGKQLFNLAGRDIQILTSPEDLKQIQNDGKNGMYLFYEEIKGSEKQRMAFTQYGYNSAKGISEADIIFNSRYDWDEVLTFQWQDKTFQTDLKATAIHEIGHLLGLNHIPPAEDPDSVMVPMTNDQKDPLSYRLSQGDIQRLRVIYGCSGECASQPSSKNQ